MILVVLYHSAVFWGEQWFTKNPVLLAPLLGIFSRWLNTVHIHGFVLVSGYILSFAKLEKGKYVKLGIFIKNKAKRLLVPYVCIAALWVIPVQSIFFDMNTAKILQNYILAIGPSQLWFLIMLFNVFIIFFALSKFFAENDVFGALVVLGAYGVGLVGSKTLPDVFQIWTALKYIPVFWLGFKLRQRGTERIRRIPTIVWIMLSIGMFAITCILRKTEGAIFTLLAVGTAFVTSIIGAVMAFVVLQNIAGRFDWKRSVFAFISKRSMGIYLLHQQVIYFCIF